MKFLMKVVAAICAMLTLATGPVAAQNSVGTSVVEGREVILYDDQTWAFRQSGTENCQLITKFLSFCGDSFVWRKNPPPNQAIAAQFTPSSTLYLQYIPENLGANDSLTYETFRNAALQYAANASGRNISDVPVLLSEDITVSGLEGQTLAYAINFNGTNVVFQNTIVITNSWSVQIQTYEIGVTEMTEKHAKHHAISLELTKLTAP